MARTTRRLLVLLTMLVLAMTLQLGAGATTASAATTCRQYDGFHTDGGVLLRDVRICAAPGTDYPNYTGWGRVVREYSTTPDPCGFSLLPQDIDEPRMGIACIAMMPPPIQAWRWTGTAWVASPGLNPGEKAYFAPYATGWRWAWTSRTGWVAIGSQHAAFRWSAP